MNGIHHYLPGHLSARQIIVCQGTYSPGLTICYLLLLYDISEISFFAYRYYAIYQKLYISYIVTMRYIRNFIFRISSLCEIIINLYIAYCYYTKSSIIHISHIATIRNLQQSIYRISPLYEIFKIPHIAYCCQQPRWQTIDLRGRTASRQPMIYTNPILLATAAGEMRVRSKKRFVIREICIKSVKKTRAFIRNNVQTFIRFLDKVQN